MIVRDHRRAQQSKGGFRKHTPAGVSTRCVRLPDRGGARGPADFSEGFIPSIHGCTPAAGGAKVPIPHTMLCRTSLITATQRIFFYTARGATHVICRPPQICRPGRLPGSPVPKTATAHTLQLAERTSELPERASELPERAPPCSPSN
jgi:hypothetical protein